MKRRHDDRTKKIRSGKYSPFVPGGSDFLFWKPGAPHPPLCPCFCHFPLQKCAWNRRLFLCCLFRSSFAKNKKDLPKGRFQIRLLTLLPESCGWPFHLSHRQYRHHYPQLYCAVSSYCKHPPSKLCEHDGLGFRGLPEGGLSHRPALNRLYREAHLRYESLFGSGKKQRKE